MKNYEIGTDVNTSYLVVSINEEKYALHVSNVLNILEVSKITKVPHAPYYMKGVIDLRGQVLPVIDTRVKMDISETIITPLTCIVVMNFVLDSTEIHIGILIDKVESVEEIETTNIKPAPSIGNRYRSTFITGVATINNEFVMILDIIGLFSNAEIDAVTDLVADEETKVDANV